MKAKESELVDITHKLNVRIPMLPNFILLKDGLSSLDIADISDENLACIADLWKVKLLEHAKLRRETRGKKPSNINDY